MLNRFVVLIFALSFATAAHAQTRGSPAVICSPDAQTVASGGLKTNLASIQFDTGATGTLTLNCQLERFDSGTAAWVLRLVYRDSTGTDLAAHARARVYRMPIGGTTATLMGTAFSNTSATTTNTSILSPEFTHPFDFAANVYWIRLDLMRVGNQTVVIHSYNLEQAN